MHNFLKKFVFPKYCFGCGDNASYLCAKCQKKLKLRGKFICPVCQKNAIDGRTHPDCQQKTKLDGIISLWFYKGSIQKMLKGMKYRFVFDLRKELKEIIDIGIENQIKNNKTFAMFLEKKPIIVAVPLYWQRLNWRGFNQAEIIAHLIAERQKLKLAQNLLIRQKNTKTQSELAKKERYVNIKDAFELNPRIDIKTLKSIKYVLLIDDIWTSGNTLNECCKVLKRKGVREVWGLTLAR